MSKNNVQHRVITQIVKHDQMTTLLSSSGLGAHLDSALTAIRKVVAILDQEVSTQDPLHSTILDIFDDALQDTPAHEEELDSIGKELEDRAQRRKKVRRDLRVGRTGIGIMADDNLTNQLRSYTISIDPIILSSTKSRADVYRNLHDRFRQFIEDELKQGLKGYVES